MILQRLDQVALAVIPIVATALGLASVTGVAAGDPLAPMGSPLYDQGLVYLPSQGQTLVLEPGREHKELAKNVLVDYDEQGMQPEVQSSFTFEGRRIYFRTRGFLYCIAEE